MKVFPKDKEALVKRSVFAKDNSEESGIVQPKAEGAFEEWKDLQKKERNKRPSDKSKRRKTRMNIINKTSYFLCNSLNKSLNQEKILAPMKADECWESIQWKENQTILQHSSLIKSLLGIPALGN